MGMLHGEMKRSANDIVEQFAIASDFCLIPLLSIALTAAKANADKKQRDAVTAAQRCLCRRSALTSVR